MFLIRGGGRGGEERKGVVQKPTAEQESGVTVKKIKEPCRTSGNSIALCTEGGGGRFQIRTM